MPKQAVLGMMRLCQSRSRAHHPLCAPHMQGGVAGGLVGRSKYNTYLLATGRCSMAGFKRGRVHPHIDSLAPMRARGLSTPSLLFWFGMPDCELPSVCLDLVLQH